MKNELAISVSLADGKSQYDAQCKKVLANRVILAWILRYSVEEFQEKDIAHVKMCIGNDICISRIRVMPGETNTREPERILGETGEDIVPGEGEVYFDIRFSVNIPGEENEKTRMVKLILNLEAQKDFYPGYSIESRAVFYASRLISAQKGTEFAGSDYDSIKKVYSIWICMNAPNYIGNAVSRYSICKEDLISGIPDHRQAYDKLAAVMICLNPRSEKGNQLTSMLNVLLASDMSAARKIKRLEEEFKIPMEYKLGKELKQMCNLSDYVEEKGIEKGIEKGKLLLMIGQIQKKYLKGKNLAAAAEEMEQEVSAIEAIYKAVQENPEDSSEEILAKVEHSL